MDPIVIVTGVLVLLGLLGVVVPLLPGSALVLLGVLLWAWETGTAAGWEVLAVVCVLLAGGAVLKYLVPGRRLRDAGIPAGTLLLAAVLGVAGFFVVPVVGLPLGFVLGIYLAELRRLRDPARARAETMTAVGAVGLSMLIEFGAALLAAMVWLADVVLA